MASKGRIGDRRGAKRVLAGKPDKIMSLVLSRCRWENNIKMCLQEVRWGAWNVLLWLGIRDRLCSLMNAAMNVRVPKIARNFLTS